LLAIGLLAAVFGYLAWTVLSSSFPAEQARLHPILAAKAIMGQLREAAPLPEWNIPFLSIVVWAAWVLGIWLCGWALLRKLLSASLPQCTAARGLLAFALGFTFFGWIEAVISSVGMARLPLIPVFAAAGAAILWRSRETRQLAAGIPAAALSQWSRLCVSGRVLIAIAVTGVILLLVPALTPPIQSDAVRYHLGAPQEFLKLGATGYIPLNAYSNMPFLAEMHYMAALGVGAPETTQLMHLTLAVFTALGIFALGRHFLTLHRDDAPGAPPPLRAAELVAPLLYLSTPMAAILATWPFTDHAMALMLTSSTLAALHCLRSNSPMRTWILLGLLLGGLIGTKYTMAPVAVAIFLLAVALARRPHSAEGTFPRGRPVGRAAAAATAATVIGGIWFARNWLLIGNPVYPFAANIFPGGEWGPANDAFLQARAGAKGFGHSLKALGTLPWTTTFRWINFEAHNPGAVVLATLLTLVVGFVTQLFCRARREAVLVFAVAAITFAIWFLTYQSNRLLLPVLAVSLGLLPVHLFLTSRLAAMVLNAAAAVFALTGFAWAVQWSWVATTLSPPPLLYLLGEQDAAQYRYRSLTYARAFDYLNKHVAPDEKVLLVGEHRIYGARFHAIWSDWFDTPALVWILRKHGITSTQSLLKYLRSTNTPWIMINEEELKPQLDRDFKPWFKPHEWQIFEELRTLDSPGVEVIQMPPGATIIHLGSAK
jgi:hypothetical protein